MKAGQGEERGSALRSAYVATAYEVHLPAGRVVIRVGQVCAELDSLLGSLGERHWAFVSAFNPRSRVLCEQENLARHENLARTVATSGLAAFEGEGRGDNRDWPAERSLLILGMPPDAALRLAVQFDQHAVVVGERGGAARLLWTPVGQENGTNAA
jgi:hypothetical protein